MARQVGPVFATGTIDGIVFYKLGDHYYMRSKGDYKCAKLMRRDPRLKRTMANADRFGQASSIVKGVYYQYLPRAVRKYGLFGQLTGLVNSWLQQGKSLHEAKEALLTHFQTLIPAVATVMSPPLETPPVKEPVQATTITEATTAQPEAIKPLVRVKQARYLSHWKVKRNGRLHIPRPVIPVVQSGPEPFRGILLHNPRPFSKRNE